MKKQKKPGSLTSAKEDIESIYIDLFKISLDKAVAEPCHVYGNPPLKDVAESIQKALYENSLPLEKIKSLVMDIFAHMQATNYLMPQSKCELMLNLCQFIKNSEIEWLTLSRSLFHFLCMAIVAEIMKKENAKHVDLELTEDQLKMTEEEQQAVFHVAGYIVYSLKKST